MSISQMFEVSGSAMSAQMVRLNTTASNMANADSVAKDPADTYRARYPIFSAQTPSAGLQSAAGANGKHDDLGVPVTVKGIMESTDDFDYRYEPGHPFADKTGMVAYPNVSVVNEMSNMISASRAFQLNVEVMNTAKTLAERILSLGQ